MHAELLLIDRVAATHSCRAVRRCHVCAPDTLSSHAQTVQYIQPQHHERLAQAELLVIDEAAAIPLPLVKQLLGPYLVFLCSTVNGCAFPGCIPCPLQHVSHFPSQVGGGTPLWSCWVPCALPLSWQHAVLYLM